MEALLVTPQEAEAKIRAAVARLRETGKFILEPETFYVKRYGRDCGCAVTAYIMDLRDEDAMDEWLHGDYLKTVADGGNMMLQRLFGAWDAQYLVIGFDVHYPVEDWIKKHGPITPEQRAWLDAGQRLRDLLE